MKNLKETYLQNPCGTLSIPYWKNKTIQLSNSIKIFHKNKFDESKYKENEFQRFFRIKHNLLKIQKTQKCQTILTKDIEELINMINISYQNKQISINIDDVNEWMKHPVFNKSLWVCIKENSKMIASGIAEYDFEIKEGILEWIQVLPEFQHKGYGKRIVYELLYRLKELGSASVAVSGTLDNKSNPERLYRSCGFSGDDIWYIISN